MNMKASTPMESVNVGTSFESSGFLLTESATKQQCEKLEIAHHKSRCERKYKMPYHHHHHLSLDDKPVVQR